MRKKMLSNLLDEHADALMKSGEGPDFDSRAWLTAKLPADTGQVLALLQLAQAISQALVPVSIDGSFRAELHESLIEMPPPTVEGARRPDRHAIYWATAAAFGLVLFALRKVITGYARRRSQAITSTA